MWAGINLAQGTQVSFYQLKVWTGAIWHVFSACNLTPLPPEKVSNHRFILFSLRPQRIFGSLSHFSVAWWYGQRLTSNSGCARKNRSLKPRNPMVLGVYRWVQPWRLTWNIMEHNHGGLVQITFLSNWVIWRFHVNFPGCMLIICSMCLWCVCVWVSLVI